MFLCEPIEKSPWKSSFGPGASGERIGDNGELGNKRHHCWAAWAGVSGCLAGADSHTHAQATNLCFPGLGHEPHGGGDGGSTLTQIQGSTPSPCAPLPPSPLSQEEELHSAFLSMREGRYAISDLVSGVGGGGLALGCSALLSPEAR